MIILIFIINLDIKYQLFNWICCHGYRNVYTKDKRIDKKIGSDNYEEKSTV
ncbi:hypothetical protein OSO01_25010 [Oceanobacillus sojae]|uniref:Uncharacterized protein n=1 Tax=Oceanobacillus sojae TaxID=582851 RepID=A0A511ZJY0_9BACI|nr:hypothetical protein OSO01_25010 [Oceanobacillus sojae]